MRDVAEILLASTLAGAVALALWPAGEAAGLSAAGDGGCGAVTVTAASAAVAAMVEDWERPVEVATEAMDMTPPVDMAALAAPETPDLPSPVRRTLPMPMPIAQPSPEPPPTSAAPERIETRAPEQSPRPPERPDPTPRPEPVEAPAPAPSQGRAAQVAAGEGASGSEGHAGNAPAASASSGQVAKLMTQWGGQIRARIARNVPRGAGSGTAVIALTVRADGGLVGASLARSSGNAQIDRLALEAVRSAGGFPPAPAGLGGGPFSFSLPIASK